MTKNAQRIENLEDLWKYKRFLDKITPKEFFEAQENTKKVQKRK